MDRVPNAGQFRPTHSRRPSDRYDAIVIGARCAGSPTAMLLARMGYRVLLLERGGVPSDSMRNHFIQTPGVVKLRQWGLLDRLIASGCPPIRTLEIDLGDFPLAEPVKVGDGVDANYAPRRFVLDGLLAEAAVEAGAELHDHFSVRELVFADGAVTGIRGKGKDGSEVTISARIVIGADGLHSMVAKAVGAPVSDYTPTLTFGYYSYFSGLPNLHMTAAVHAQTREFAIAFPTHGDLHCVAVQRPVDGFAGFRQDIEGSFFKSLAFAPWIADHVHPANRAEQWRGTADLPNFFRKPYGNGWALVGDAGLHKDPLTAQGISDAFRDAELLADAVDAGLSGRMELSSALAGYEEGRRVAAQANFTQAVARAAFAPFPDAVYQARVEARYGNRSGFDVLPNAAP